MFKARQIAAMLKHNKINLSIGSHSEIDQGSMSHITNENSAQQIKYAIATETAINKIKRINLIKNDSALFKNLIPAIYTSDAVIDFSKVWNVPVPVSINLRRLRL